MMLYVSFMFNSRVVISVAVSMIVDQLFLPTSHYPVKYTKQNEEIYTSIHPFYMVSRQLLKKYLHNLLLTWNRLTLDL